VESLEKTWFEHDKVTDPDLQGDYDEEFSTFLKMLDKKTKSTSKPKTTKTILYENQENQNI